MPPKGSKRASAASSASNDERADDDITLRDEFINNKAAELVFTKRMQVRDRFMYIIYFIFINHASAQRSHPSHVPPTYLCTLQFQLPDECRPRRCLEYGACIPPRCRWRRDQGEFLLAASVNPVVELVVIDCGGGGGGCSSCCCCSCFASCR